MAMMTDETPMAEAMSAEVVAHNVTAAEMTDAKVAGGEMMAAAEMADAKMAGGEMMATAEVTTTAEVTAATAEVTAATAAGKRTGSKREAAERENCGQRKN